MVEVDGELDLSPYKWQEFHFEDENGYLVHHDQTILDYDAVMYEAYDKEMNVVAEVTIDRIVQDFEANAK
ncbi:MAG: hypothetical protein NXI30_02420 [bacterium]|nr:hypothetical protein [bacterium]